MSIPISTVVNVQVAMPPSYPTGTGLSTLLFLGKSNRLPLSARAQFFASVQDVGALFSSTDEEYKAAESFFSQNPRPASMAIGRAVAGPTGGEMLGSGNYEDDLSVWKALAPSEVLYLTIDGSPVEITGMIFANVANLNGVAAVVNGALSTPLRSTSSLAADVDDAVTDIPLATAPTIPLQIGDLLYIEAEYMTVTDATDQSNPVVTRASKGSVAAAHLTGALVTIEASGVAAATCTFTGSAFYFKSGLTGTTSGVLVTQSSPLSDMLGLGSGAITTPGIEDAETPADALDACSAMASFYGVVLTKEFTDADALLAAEWVQAQTMLMGHATGDANSKVAAVDTDFCAEAAARGYDRVATSYHEPQNLSDYLMVSALARELAVDFTQPSSAITMKFKVCPGVAVSNLNINDKNALDSKHANYYAMFGSVPMFAEGWCASGLFIDLRHGLDYMAKHLADSAFMGMYAAPKIPQTDKGLTYLVGLLEIAMEDMVNSGFLAPGTWNGTGINNVVNTGEFLTKGYKVVPATIASQSEADRQARKAPPVTIACKAAGAFHSVDIFVQFEP
jgi:Protein of unknown function (DUF3383)